MVQSFKEVKFDREGRSWYVQMNVRTRKVKMNSKTSVVIGFIFGILLGSAFVIYLKLWSMDSTFSAQEAELLRKEFDRANMEAMDESAEWRMKYDLEVDRAKRYKTDLERVKKSLASAKLKLEKSQKENTLLHKQEDIKSKTPNCKCADS